MIMKNPDLRYLVDPQLTDMPFVPRRVFPPFVWRLQAGVHDVGKPR